MSLDVSLTLRGAKIPKGSGIFIREDGQILELTREEWDLKYPGREPVVLKPEEQDSEEVFSANITHNLRAMALEAGIYHPIWVPEETDITKAGQLIGLLHQGLVNLRKDPPRFMKHNPENGWGSYEMFVPWVKKYLEACEAYPDADIHVSR